MLCQIATGGVFGPWLTGGLATFVFGRHSHVAAGIELRGSALIFYG